MIRLMLGTILLGSLFVLSLCQQDVLGYSPLMTGVHNLAIALTVIATSAVSQALVMRIGVRPILIVGLVFLGSGLAYYTQISVDGSYLTDLLFPGFLLTAVGLGFSFTPVSIAALSGVTSAEAGLASGLICGPTGFVESAAGGLVDLGHDPSRIRTERFGPTGA